MQQPGQQPPLPHMRYKSADALRAQVVSYAETIANPSDRNGMLAYAGQASDEELRNPTGPVTRYVQPGEYFKSEGGYQAEGERVIGTNEAYVRALRSETDRKREERAGRVALFKNYEYFRDHPVGEPIGSGDEATVHRFNMNGKSYVSIRPHATNPNSRNSIDNRMMASVRNSGRNNPIVAGSFEGDGEIIAEALPGKGIGDLSIDDLKHIRYHQLQDLAQSVIEESKDGVLIDALQKADNILYDVKEGFNLIDLGVLTPDITNYPMHAQLALSRIGHHLGFGKTNQVQLRGHDDYRLVADELQVRLFVVKGYQAALSALPIHNAAVPPSQYAEMGEGVGQAAAAACDSVIRDVEKKIAQFRDQDFVREDLIGRYRSGRAR